METDVSLESKQDADGKLTTAGPVDLFRIYNEQIAVVEDIDQGEILFKVARALLGAMDAFQKAERSKIESDLMPKASAPARACFTHALWKLCGSLRPLCSAIVKYFISLLGSSFAILISDHPHRLPPTPLLPCSQGRIEHLCAMVNSNLQCYDLSEDFQEYVKEVVADGYKASGGRGTRSLPSSLISLPSLHP